MERGSTLFLKFSVILIDLPILALCIFLVPEIGNTAAQLAPESAYMKPLVFFVYDGAAVPFYFALYQAFALLSYIDKNSAFSEMSVKALRKIKFCAITISVMHLFVLPVFYLFAEMDDAPGVIFVGLVMPFASLVIAVFAAVLQRLLQDAIVIKSENDLTV